MRKSRIKSRSRSRSFRKVPCVLDSEEHHFPCPMNSLKRAFIALAIVSLARPLWAAPAYPLKPSANGRYLLDQNNVPCMIVGDSPQALMVNLSTNEAAYFFAD